MTQENSDHASNLANSAISLSRQADELKSIVMRFRLSAAPEKTGLSLPEPRSDTTTL